MRVLIATDGSDVAISAARRGCDLLGAIDEITLLNVMPDGDPGADAGGIEGPVLTAAEQEAFLRDERETARVELTRTASALGTAEIVQIVEEGEPAAAICRAAERLAVDVIIVGSHGRTGLGRLFLGSVSEHVVRHAPCPVLVIGDS